MNVPVVSRSTRTEALLAVATFCLVALAAATADGSLAQATLAYCFAAGFAVLLLFSRDWPVPALLATAFGIVVYYVLDLPPIGLAAPAAAALYLTAERGRALSAAVVGGTLLVVSVGARLIEGDDISVVLGSDLGSGAVLMLAVVALGDAVRARRSLRAEMARQADAAAEDRRREAARQVEAERLRIAREVHDTLGHMISVITLQSAVAQEALADRAPAQAMTALAAIRTAGSGAMAELRATLGTLRRDSGTRHPTPGIDQLSTLVDGVVRSGLPVDLRLTGELDSLPSIVGTTTYRLVQEALTNALRHARATRVAVTVRLAGSQLSVEVIDDGHGVAAGHPPDEKGQGLHGMSERVALLGGVVDAGNADTGGFRVHALLPLPGSRS